MYIVQLQATYLPRPLYSFRNTGHWWIVSSHVCLGSFSPVASIPVPSSCHPAPCSFSWSVWVSLGFYLCITNMCSMLMPFLYCYFFLESCQSSSTFSTLLGSCRTCHSLWCYVSTRWCYKLGHSWDCSTRRIICVWVNFMMMYEKKKQKKNRSTISNSRIVL